MGLEKGGGEAVKNSPVDCFQPAGKSHLPHQQKSVPAGTDDMHFEHDIRFAGDIRLQCMIRKGYHIMLSLGGNISYGLGRISYRAAIYHSHLIFFVSK